MATNSSRYFGIRTGFLAFILCVGAIVLVNWQWIVLYPIRTYLISFAMLLVALAIIGIGVNGRPDGVIIDNRNRVSLSKFQAVTWTVLVLAALATAAAHNLSIGDPNPLWFDIPSELLAAMGISAGSFVATPLVLSLKADDTPAPQDEAKLATAMNMAPEDMQNDGKVFGRKNASQASWSDIFRGEEIGNAASPDLSKIQQFFISLLLYGIYGVAIVQKLTPSVTRIDSLPPLNEKFVWLLALSHASYIAYKAVPHTRDGDDTADTPGVAPANGANKPVG